MNQMIDELNRQRAERHRLVDAEYDDRIRLVPHECEKLTATMPHDIFGVMTWIYPECKHCRAPMPEPLSNT